ncbi:hypothetical protein RU07_18455 [Agrobacterium tumefaciens]|uniref:Uncharacterized protein n=1 Tax=Agrobacterium tumefaciens TaxID=358 RepID=A0A0D0J290_AGRTU|nr:hypothetical protein RU07_18455 [Agrobacterium tumefaciens]
MRQMVNQLQNLPTWGPGQFIDTSKSYIEFDLSPPIQHRSPSLDIQLTLERVSDLFGQKKWLEVIEALDGAAAEPMARRFFVGALAELGDDALTMRGLSNPHNLVEAVILGTAIIESGEASDARRFLDLEIVIGQTDASLQEIKTRLKRKIAK